MKATPFLLLALGAASAFACKTYYYCHCYDSDESSNDNATNSVCTNWYGTGTTNGQYGVECCLGDGSGMNNCDFRMLCAVAFATGSDSSCRDRCESGTCT
jgi:hypothetical protein